MRTALGVLLCAFLFVGCYTAKKAAVTTFHVIDAPANYIRRHIDDEQTTTTTTTTTRSDVTNPGQPVAAAPPPRRTTSQSRGVAAQGSARAASANAPAPRTSTASPQRPSPQQAQSFPTAKAVPGKPGFVISPFDPNGGYVDVTGYPSGSKAKDPYSQKIFVVP